MTIDRRKALLIPIFALIVALVWAKPLDDVAEKYVETGLQRALVTFAAARTLNAVISVVQGMSFSVSVGAGASIQPGAALDPLDDLVEQFSALMLAATLSFATQRLLITVFSAWPYCAAATAVILLWFALRWRSGTAPAWIPKLALALVCLRLAIPVVALASESTYQLLLAKDYETSQSRIQVVDLPDIEIRPEEGMVERIKRWWAQSSDIGKKLETLKQKADEFVRHLVRLAAVFIVQTVLLPLLTLWAMAWLYRALTGLPFARAREPTVISETRAG